MEGPFSMSFGQLKRLLVNEEVVGENCRDTEIREHIESQLHDVSVKSKPLKYQMAWLVKELDLLNGFEGGANEPSAPPSREQPALCPRGKAANTATAARGSFSKGSSTRNPLRRSGSWSESSSAAGSRRSSSTPRSDSAKRSTTSTSSRGSSASRSVKSAGSSSSSGRNPPPSARPAPASSRKSSSTGSSGYGKAPSPRVYKVRPPSERDQGQPASSKKRTSTSQPRQRSGSQVRSSSSGGPRSSSSGRGGAGWGVNLEKPKNSGGSSTSGRSGATRSNSGVSSGSVSLNLELPDGDSGGGGGGGFADDQEDVASVARAVAGGVLLGTYEVLDVSGLRPEEASPLVWHRMSEVMKKEGGLRAMELFRRFDKDNNGYIDPREFRQALVLMSCTGHTDALVTGIIALADTMGGGGGGGGAGKGSTSKTKKKNGPSSATAGGRKPLVRKNSAGFGRGAPGVKGGDGRLEYKEVIEAMRNAQLSSAVAWRHVLAFLRESPEGARAVESMFSSPNGSGESRALTKSELAAGMVSIGVELTSKQVDAFKDDLDVNKDGKVSLEEFSSAVEQRSVDTASAEREGWSHVLGSLLLSSSNNPDHPHDDGGEPGKGEGGGEGEGGGGAERRMKEIQVAFDFADENGDGVLDLKELVQLLCSLGVRLSDVQGELLREAMDTNGDGMISRDEFVAVLEQQRSLASDMVWFAFLHFMRENSETAGYVEEMFEKADADGNESLDVAELSSVVTKLGMVLDPLQLHLFHADLDLNGNGSITLDEFTTAIEQHGAALAGLLEPPPPDGPETEEGEEGVVDEQMGGSGGLERGGGDGVGVYEEDEGVYGDETGGGGGQRTAEQEEEEEGVYDDDDEEEDQGMRGDPHGGGGGGAPMMHSSSAEEADEEYEQAADYGEGEETY